MIEKVKLSDVMNGLPFNKDANYVYVEKDNKQYRIVRMDLMIQSGFYRREIILQSGAQFELPFNGGLILIQNATISHNKAVAILHGDNSSRIIVEERSINFMSEVPDKICVFNTGIGNKYIVKNTNNTSNAVYVTFIR